LAKLTCAALAAGAISGLTATAALAAPNPLVGDGSTLVAPILNEWGAAWAQATGQPAPQYTANGSGQGLKDIGKGLVDFAGSDAPLSASTTSCSGCTQLPWALSATGVTWNVSGVRRLHLTGPVLAGIYLGQITKWNDPRITSLNKGLGDHFPNQRISVFFRSDGSGDSYAFTDYLSAVSGAWRSRVGRGTLPAFPVGGGAKGNAGMVSAVQGTPGSIAYVAVTYLISHRMGAAAIKNAAGRYETPNLNNIANAARNVHLSGNNEVHIVNPPRRDGIAYPISTFTYVIVRPTDAFGNGAALRSFISYAVTGGQAFGPRIDFVPIPQFIRGRDQAALGAIH
jgi:phosphate transport system substrate-binding protein